MNFPTKGDNGTANTSNHDQMSTYRPKCSFEQTDRIVPQCLLNRFVKGSQSIQNFFGFGYNFIYFGHNPELVHVLDGGFKKWIKEDKATTSDIIKIIPSNYIANEKRELVKDINQINKNILENNFNVIDARSLERFEGKVPEPRKGLRSGSIKNSFCLPFSELINQDHTFISKENNIIMS